MTTERNIEKKILARLSTEYHKRGLFIVRDVGDFVPIGTVSAAVNQAAKNPGAALSILKNLIRRRLKIGLKGEPDISGCLDGLWIGIEVKKPSEKQSPGQIKFQKAIEQRGGIYIIATSPDDAIEQIEKALTARQPPT